MLLKRLQDRSQCVKNGSLLKEYSRLGKGRSHLISRGVSVSKPYPIWRCWGRRSLNSERAKTSKHNADRWALKMLLPQGEGPSLFFSRGLPSFRELFMFPQYSSALFSALMLSIHPAAPATHTSWHSRSPQRTAHHENPSLRTNVSDIKIDGTQGSGTFQQ